MNKKQSGQQFRKLCLSIPLSIALSGLAVLVYQGYFWLKQGYWKSLDSNMFLSKVLPANFLQWLHNPKSWLGLNKIVVPIFNLPMTLFLLLFGLVILLLADKISALFLKHDKTEPIGTRRWRRL